MVCCWPRAYVLGRGGRMLLAANLNPAAGRTAAGVSAGVAGGTAAVDEGATAALSGLPNIRPGLLLLAGVSLNDGDAL